MLRTTLLSSRPRAIPRQLPSSFRSTLHPQHALRKSPIHSPPHRPFQSISKPRLSPSKPHSPSHPPSPRSPPSHLLQNLRTLLSRRFINTFRRRFKSNFNSSSNPHPNSSPNTGSTAAEAEPQSLGAKMRKLSREYGWSALGVYAGLSALDFPFCYLLVRWVGTEKIGEWEHIVNSKISLLISDSLSSKWHEWRSAMKANKPAQIISNNEENAVSETVEMAGWGVEEADEQNEANASLATQLALAYAIHKSFIFIRVPLTAAVTPKVVRVLRGWGWDIGKRTTKEAKALRRATLQSRPKRVRRWGIRRNHGGGGVHRS